MARRTPDPEQARGERILRQLGRLERRKPQPRFLGCLPWALALFLVLVIALVVILNLDRFRQFAGQLFEPAGGL